MLKRLVVPALSLALLASSAHAEAPIPAEREFAAWKRVDAQLKGLSITPWGKVAVWRDRSLRTPQAVADMKIVKRYLQARHKLTGEHLLLHLYSGPVVTRQGTIPHGYYIPPSKRWWPDVPAADVVSEIHNAAEAIRAGMGMVLNVQSHNWLLR